MQGGRSAKCGVRNALREATRNVHERLHQTPAFAAIASQQLDVAGYTRLLERIAAFHCTVGQDVELDAARPQLLAQDLEALGSPAPRPVHWSSPKTAAATLGLAYVVEGSALGGKEIYRQLDYLFGQSPEGRRFFRGATSDVPRWQALCRELEAKGQSSHAVDEMIAGATAAFALFEQLVVPGHAPGAGHA
jgi:heme oxygenase